MNSSNSYNLCVCTYTHMNAIVHSTHESQRSIFDSQFSSTICEIKQQNLGHQAWWSVPYPLSHLVYPSNSLNGNWTLRVHCWVLTFGKGLKINTQGTDRDAFEEKQWSIRRLVLHPTLHENTNMAFFPTCFSIAIFLLSP